MNSVEPVRQVQRCLYFEGGDADGKYERRLVEEDTDMIGGPASSRSTYERTNRVVIGNGDKWQVWAHTGDWRPYRDAAAP